MEEVDEFLDSLFLGDSGFDDLSFSVEGDFASGGSDVSVVGVGHFSGAVDDASHDGDVEAFEVAGGVPDFIEDGGEIEFSASARGAGDVFDLGFAEAAGLEDFVADGDFVDGVFGEADSDGVADSFHEEGCDSGGGFDAGVLSVSGFGDAKVEGVVHAFFVDAHGHEAVGGDHDGDSAGFGGDVEVVVAVFFAEPEVFDGGFDHASGGVAVGDEDAFGQGAVVDADSHGAVVFYAGFDDGDEVFFDGVDFGLPFFG